MINARYHHYHDERRRDCNISKRHPTRKGTGTRKQQKNATRALNQERIDNMFQPVPRSQRSIWRQAGYKELQQRMREFRSRRAQRPANPNQPPVAACSFSASYLTPPNRK
jgi:hypothetical protein